MLLNIVREFAPNDNFDGALFMGGLGSNVGPVKLEDGTLVKGGHMIMWDTWIVGSSTPLMEQHQPGDICIHKNRLSEYWGGTSVEEALTSRGIRKILFAGSNTDQCVGSSLQDALIKGWDCLLLNDRYATTSRDYCRHCIEYEAKDG